MMEKFGKFVCKHVGAYSKFIVILYSRKLLLHNNNNNSNNNSNNNNSNNNNSYYFWVQSSISTCLLVTAFPLTQLTTVVTSSPFSTCNSYKSIAHCNEQTEHMYVLFCTYRCDLVL
jgi:hypothetical protein